MWFGYVQRRSIYAIVRKIDCIDIKSILRERERLRKIWKETVRNDFKFVDVIE